MLVLKALLLGEDEQRCVLLVHGWTEAEKERKRNYRTHGELSKDVF